MSREEERLKHIDIACNTRRRDSRTRLGGVANAKALLACAEEIAVEIEGLNLTIRRFCEIDWLEPYCLKWSNDHDDSKRSEASQKSTTNRRKPRSDSHAAQKALKAALATKPRPSCLKAARVVIAAIHEGVLVQPASAIKAAAKLDGTRTDDKDLERFWRNDVVYELKRQFRSSFSRMKDLDIGEKSAGPSLPEIYCEYVDWKQACRLLAKLTESTATRHKNVSLPRFEVESGRKKRIAALTSPSVVIEADNTLTGDRENHSDTMRAEKSREMALGAPAIKNALQQPTGDGVSGTQSGSQSDVARIVIDEEKFTVEWNRQIWTANKRGKFLFELFHCLNHREGNNVLFARLCDNDGPWHNRKVEESTIRSAISRLRRELRTARMPELAKAIYTGIYRNVRFARLDLARITPPN